MGETARRSISSSENKLSQLEERLPSLMSPSLPTQTISFYLCDLQTTIIKPTCVDCATPFTDAVLVTDVVKQRKNEREDRTESYEHTCWGAEECKDDLG